MGCSWKLQERLIGRKTTNSFSLFPIQLYEMSHAPYMILRRITDAFEFFKLPYALEGRGGHGLDFWFKGGLFRIQTTNTDLLIHIQPEKSLVSSRLTNLPHRREDFRIFV